MRACVAPDLLMVGWVPRQALSRSSKVVYEARADLLGVVPGSRYSILFRRSDLDRPPSRSPGSILPVFFLRTIYGRALRTEASVVPDILIVGWVMMQAWECVRLECTRMARFHLPDRFEVLTFAAMVHDPLR